MAAERGRPTRGRAFVAASAIAFVIMAVRVPGGPLAAAAGCEPEYDPSVSTPAEVIPRYPHREATTDEIYRYFEVVDSEATGWKTAFTGRRGWGARSSTRW